MLGIIVDIGTGDGKFVYEIAKAHPDRFVIGIDPNHKGLVETSRKIYKKPEKGGLKNALFVLARVEDLPEELNGTADQIFINFPWSGLLQGIVEVTEETWRALKRIGKKGTLVDIVLGYSDEDRLKLPGLDGVYIATMREKLRGLGLQLKKFKKLSDKEIKNYPSTWGKKLRFGKGRDYYFLQVELT